MKFNAPEHIRPVDQAVLDLLRQSHSLSVQDFTGLLEVTATAVRQRLERLVQVDLVGRNKVGSGRGRPQFVYSLTPLGMRYASASYAELASALWMEVMELPDRQEREQILQRVARRMGAALRQALPHEADLNTRFSAMASALGKRKIPASVTCTGELPVLSFHACPYPELSENDDTRQMCEVEQEMMSEALGQHVELDCCRLDGHHQCQFRAAGAITSPPGPVQNPVQNPAWSKNPSPQNFVT